MIYPHYWNRFQNNQLKKTHADGALIFGVVETDEHFSFSLADSFLTLLPDSNWFGSGVISVLATDGLDTVFTDFSLNVTNVNDPVFGADMFENVSIIEDSTAIVQLESHFSDIDSDLSFSATADSLPITLSVDGNTLIKPSRKILILQLHCSHIF